MPGNPTKEDLVNDLTSGALILFDAFALYEVLTPSEGLKPFPQIRGNGSWKTSAREAFRQALVKNYDSVFLYALKVLDALPSAKHSEAALQEIYKTAQEVASKAGLLRNDLSGRVYHSALGRQVAKAFATYYTGLPAAELLAWLAIDNYEARVADFAAGSGTLLMGAYHRKLALAFSQGFTGTVDELHRRFVQEQIWGFDAMPFASHLTLVNLALQQPSVTFRKGRVYTVPCGGNRMGSLDLLKSDTIAVQQRLDSNEAQGAIDQAMEGASTVVNLQVRRQSFDLVIMNPPFTRNDRASRVLSRKLLRQALKKLGGSLTVAGLGAPFVRLADMEVAPDGRVAFVLPAAVLFAESWQPVREVLLADYHIEYVFISWASDRPAFSEGTNIREVLLLGRKSKGDGPVPGLRASVPNDTHIVHLDRSPTILEAREIALRLREVTQHSAPYSIAAGEGLPLMVDGESVGTVISVPVGLLSRSVDNWYRLLSFRSPKIVKLALSLRGLLPLRSVPYGVNLTSRLCPLDEVGSAKLFMKNVGTAGYRVHKTDPGPGGIPFVEGVELRHARLREGDTVWVKYDPALVKTEKFDPETGNLLLVRKTNAFASLRVCAATAESAGTTGGMFFPVQMTGSSTKDKKTVTGEEMARLETIWFNSTFGLICLLSERAETEGAYMSWPTERIRLVRALDPESLTRRQVDDILELWPEVEAAEWPLMREQLEASVKNPKHLRRRIDNTIIETFDEGARALPDDFYQLVLDQLVALRAVMSPLPAAKAGTKEESEDGELDLEPDKEGASDE